MAASAALLASILTACGPAGSGGAGSRGEAAAPAVPEINFYNAPQETLDKIVERCNRRAAGRYRITLNVLPRDADGQREQLVRRLAAGDPGLDVLGMDVTWTAELAEAGWIRKWTGPYEREARQGTLAKPLDTAIWRGSLYAAPYTTNVQLLWYRADLVNRPPSRWAELMAVAADLAARGKPHYVEVTGAQYEGIVTWFNSLVAAGGGRILGPGDEPAAESVALGRPAREALTIMRDFARSKAADPSLSNTQEDQARLAMEAGAAAFEVNWPFVYPAMVANRPDLVSKLRWAPFPGIDGPGPSPLGGANLGVSTYSRHPDEAFQAALCLRDQRSQKTAAVKDGLPPTIGSVYADPHMVQPYPMRDAILAALKTARPRPSTPSYQNVSTVAAAVLSPPSAIDPPRALAKLHTEISNALRSKGVLP